MRNLVHFAAAAALLIGGLAYMGLADDKPGTGDKWAWGRIHTALKQTTNYAVEAGGAEKMTEMFVDGDRDRLKTWFKDPSHKDQMDKYNAMIDQFRKDWKDKYGQDFKFEKDEVVFGDPQAFSIATGEIGKEAQLAGMTVPPADTGNTARHLDKGRNIAYLTVANLDGAPEMKVPLIHEAADVWKIDVPDNVDGQKFFDSLMANLSWYDQHKDKWPADMNVGYRAVAHHVLMAAMGFGPDTKEPIHVELGAKSATERMDTAKPHENK